MLELFFDNHAMFEDYGARQKWARRILKDCDFVWAVPEKAGPPTMSGPLLT
jgi:reverse gyrase